MVTLDRCLKYNGVCETQPEFIPAGRRLMNANLVITLALAEVICVVGFVAGIGCQRLSRNCRMRWLHKHGKKEDAIRFLRQIKAVPSEDWSGQKRFNVNFYVNGNKKLILLLVATWIHFLPQGSSRDEAIESVAQSLYHSGNWNLPHRIKRHPRVRNEILAAMSKYAGVCAAAGILP